MSKGTHKEHLEQLSFHHTLKPSCEQEARGESGSHLGACRDRGEKSIVHFIFKSFPCLTLTEGPDSHQVVLN